MDTEYIEISGPTKICTILGVNTPLGQALTASLVASGRMVYGFTQDEEFNLEADPAFVAGEENSLYPPAPVISDWLVICLEPTLGFDKYTAALRQLCDHLQQCQFCGKVCLLSSASICFSPDAPISEESLICPRTELALCLATAENILNVMLYKTGNEAEICVYRLPSLYGCVPTTQPNSFGFIDAQIQQAKTSGVVDFPIFQDSKRSLLHVADACQVIINLLEKEYAPSLVNIPGEDLSLEEILSPIAEKFQARLKRFTPEQDDHFFLADDQLVSDKLCNSTVKFTRTVSFTDWLKQADERNIL